MRKNNLFSVIFIFMMLSFLHSSFVFAQERMTLQQCVEQALKNNFSIQIAKNESDIAKNDVSWGNAGALPQAGLNASVTKASNNTKQKYSSGLEVDKSGVGSNGLNLGLAFNWTIFDGMKMFATHEKLQQLSDMGELNAKLQVENKLAEVITSYYQVVEQRQLLKAIENGISIYKERKDIAETKLRIGNGSYADILQASVDLNEQKSALLKQKTALSNSKMNMNQLMGREASLPFDVEDSIPVMELPAIDALKNSVSKQNTSILFAEKNVTVSEQTIKEMNALRYPKVGLTGSYNFAKAQNQAGFILLNQNLGLNAGITASWNLFNGWNTNRQIKDAQLSFMSASLGLKDLKNQIDASLMQSYNNFQNALEVLKLETENVTIAKENADIALEKFRLSSSTALDLKIAQKSFLDAETRLLSARFEAKAAETDLLRMQSNLIK